MYIVGDVGHGAACMVVAGAVLDVWHKLSSCMHCWAWSFKHHVLQGLGSAAAMGSDADMVDMDCENRRSCYSSSCTLGPFD